jgi:hypothetical protein
MVAASGVYVLALSNNHLLRVKAGKQEQVDIDLGRRPDDQIQQLFMDPTAEHMLIWSVRPPERSLCSWPVARTLIYAAFPSMSVTAMHLRLPRSVANPADLLLCLGLKQCVDCPLWSVSACPLCFP